jgi:protein tyrosine phosphatase (PTP) superfamily phosphohydrolase (DUF442 family)
MRRRTGLLAAAAAVVLPPSRARATQATAPALDAPNVVTISPLLVTAGQPTVAALERLGAMGFSAVIYLAPPTVPDAVADEPQIVRRQGLVFVNIPVAWNDPRAEDLDAFIATLAAQRAARPAGRVLVHCQVNLRASSFTFLQRVIAGGEPPEAAWDAVARVWQPNGTWRRFIVAQLRRHGIGYEPL